MVYGMGCRHNVCNFVRGIEAKNSGRVKISVEIVENVVALNCWMNV